MKVLAIVGLSGVGKSTLIAELSRRLPLLHLQASDLIKAEQARLAVGPSTSEQLRTGAVLDNQSLLISGFKRMAAGYEGVVVLDGHILIDTADGVVEIPSSVFARLQCEHVAVITDEPTDLLRRRQRDQARRRPERSSSDIREQQERMCELASQIAAELNISCTFHQAGNGRTLEELVLKLLSS